MYLMATWDGSDKPPPMFADFAAPVHSQARIDPSPEHVHSIPEWSHPTPQWVITIPIQKKRPTSRWIVEDPDIPEPYFYLPSTEMKRLQNLQNAQRRAYFRKSAVYRREFQKAIEEAAQVRFRSINLMYE